MRRYVYIISAVIVTALLFTSCSVLKKDSLSNISDKKIERDGSVVFDEEICDIYKNFNAKILSSIAKENSENIVFSPASLYFPLATIMQGAKGKTEAQMETLLGSAANAQSFYDSLYKSTVFNDGKSYSLYDNLIAVDSGKDNEQKLLPEYTEKIKTFYKGTLKSMDFSDKKNIELIIEFIEKGTKGAFKPEIKVDDKTALLVVNTAAFNDLWSFGELEKDKIIFNDGTRLIHMDAVKLCENIYFENGQDVTKVEIPYKNGLRFFIAMPTDGKLSEDYFKDSEKLKKLFELPKDEGNVELRFPIFNVKTERELNRAVKSAGLDLIFSQEADFTGILKSNFIVSEIIQGASINVNEKGTKAEAYTVIEGDKAAAPTETTSIKIDKPFVYAVVNEQGLPIFSGIFRGK